MIDTLVIYHKNCVDGFAAAWCAHERFVEEIEYIPASYGDEPPDVKGKRVFILDFSYKRNVMLKLIEEAKELLCLDHHETAEKELENLPHCFFDMTKSGAMLSWCLFFKYREHTAPKLIKYVQDRDLWKNELPNSLELSTYIRSFPFTFEAWDNLYKIFQDSALLKKGIEEGQAILRYQKISIEDHIALTTCYPLPNQTENIPQVNCTDKDIVSLLGRELCKKYTAPYSASFRTEGNKIIYSLRSIGDFDVSELAKQYGGGGHKNAAGFSMEIKC